MPTADKFAEAVRQGIGTFALDNVRIDCGQRRILRGSGSVTLKPDHLELALTVPNSVHVPQDPTGIIKPSDCWKFAARVEGRLGIFTDRLTPAPRRRIGDRVQTLTFKVDAVDMEIKGVDRQTTNQFRTQFGQPPLKDAKRRIGFFAQIPKTDLMFLNAITETTVKHPFLGAVGSSSRIDTYLAETKDFEFCLVERDGDLHVHARSLPGYSGRNRVEDKRLMQGLLTAIGFTHGVHPWPCRQKAWLNGRLWLNRVQVPEPRAHSRYCPFPRGHAMGIKENNPKLGVGLSISLAAEYFGSGGSLAETVASLLHLYREATDSDTHFRLGTHALCSILEGLVRAIADEITATQPQAKAAAARFAAAQTEAAQALKLHLEDSTETRRLVGLVEKAQMFSIQDEFKRVCGHLELPWDELFVDHFKAWKAERHRTHHGHLSEARDVEFHHQALIAAGILLLVLRAIGYHGLAFRKLWGIGSKACQI